ncbi:MAG: hypothetical protein P1U63_08295 [Coxiellaceae bacterium]|nr:hypothetical protein [Coxiellaceae bacterium]
MIFRISFDSSDTPCLYELDAILTIKPNFSAQCTEHLLWLYREVRVSAVAQPQCADIAGYSVLSSGEDEYQEPLSLVDDL